LEWVHVWVEDVDAWLSPLADSSLLSVFVSDGEFQLASNKLLLEWKVCPVEVVDNDIFRSWVPKFSVDQSIPIYVFAQGSGPFGFSSSCGSTQE